MNTHVKPPAGEKIPTTAPVLDIHGRMIAVMRDLGAIGKDKKNEQQGFKYRGIDQVYNALHPILAEHGVYMRSEVISKTREERTNKNGTVLAFTCLRMRYTFVAEDGTVTSTEVEGEGMDSGDKSSNKAMAVAHKYALLQAFCIPTEDLVDPDAEVHEVSGKAAPPVNAQRAAIHGSKPVYDDDPDGQATAWGDQQKHFLNNCQSVADVQHWEELRADGLDRMKRKNIRIWSDVVKHKEARIEAINKAGTK